MRTLGRIVIILVAALVVAGATVALSQSSLAASVLGRGGRAGFERRAVEGQLPAGQFQGNFERRGGGEEAGGVSLFDIAPIIKDVVIMGGITAIVVSATIVLRAGKRSKPAQQSLAAHQVVNQQGLN